MILHVFCQFRLDQLTVTVENVNKPQDTESQEYVSLPSLF